MEREDYLLLKVIETARGIAGRKKLQKLIYLLQLEGYPIHDEFSVHYYGPYSSRLASRVDGLVEGKLLAESPDKVGGGPIQYAYDLTERGKELLRQIDEDDHVPPDLRDAPNRFQPRIADLCRRTPFELELGATIAYWRKMGNTWSEAEEITARMKQADVKGKPFHAARDLAKRALPTPREC